MITQEEKQLLLKDICARLPYGIMVTEFDEDNRRLSPPMPLTNLENHESYYGNLKPYLRPISSMTEEERAEMGTAIQKDRIEPYGEIKNFGEDNLLLCTIRQSTNLQDWLNAHHFDYRGLIHIGLALEAPEDMYEISK